MGRVFGRNIPYLKPPALQKGTSRMLGLTLSLHTETAIEIAKVMTGRLDKRGW